MDSKSQHNRSGASNVFGDKPVRDTKKNRKEQKKKIRKITFKEEYEYVKKLPETKALNWTVEYRNKGLRIECWEPEIDNRPKKEKKNNNLYVITKKGHVKHNIKVYYASWYYIDYKTNKLYVGTKDMKMLLSKETRKYNSSYTIQIQSWDEIEKIVLPNLICAIED